MSASNNGEDQLQDVAWNHETTGTPSADLYVQIHDGYPGEDGTSNVLSVARAQVDFSVSAGGMVQNVSVVDFDMSGSGNAVAWSAHDSAGSGTPPTGGNCWWWGWNGTVSGLAIVRSGDLTNNDVQSVAHGLAANDRVAFEAVEGLTLPAPLAANTLYHVIATGLTTDAFRVSTSSGGSAVDITAAGSAVWRKVLVSAFTAGQRVRYSAGTLQAIID